MQNRTWSISRVPGPSVHYLVKRYVEFVPLRGRPPRSEHDQEEVVDLPEGDLGPHLVEGGGEDEGDDGEGEGSKGERDDGVDEGIGVRMRVKTVRIGGRLFGCGGGH